MAAYKSIFDPRRFVRADSTDTDVLNSVPDGALSSNVALLNRNAQNFTGSYNEFVQVGIGGVPAKPLDNFGQSYFRDAIFIGAGPADRGLISFGTSPGELIIEGLSGQRLSLGSNGVQDRVIIDTGGNVGIGGTPATSGLLDLQSTTGALIVPRMTTTQKNALTAVDGMIVYDTTLGKFQGRQGGIWSAFSVL